VPANTFPLLTSAELLPLLLLLLLACCCLLLQASQRRLRVQKQAAADTAKEQVRRCGTRLRISCHVKSVLQLCCCFAAMWLCSKCVADNCQQQVCRCCQYSAGV
jgi:uncharacterized membrane protein